MAGAGIITGGVGAGGDPFLPASWEYGV